MASSIYDKSKGRLLTLQDLKSYRTRPVVPIIHSGILSVGSRMVVFGDESTFKSALTTHGAFQISRGSPFMGFNTTQSNVLIIQAEMDMGQSKERIEQYSEGSKAIYLSRSGHVPDELTRAEKYAYPDNIIIESVTDDLNIDTENGYQFIRGELELMVTELSPRPVVVIADPMFKLFRYDMMKEDNLKVMARNIDRLLRDKFLWANHPGMAFVLVHHTRKAQADPDGNIVQLPGSTEMFGSKELGWWSDTIIRCSLDADDETDSTIKVTFPKHRRAKYPPPREIGIFWDRDTFHPHVKYRRSPAHPDDTVSYRGANLGLLE